MTLTTKVKARPGDLITVKELDGHQCRVISVSVSSTSAEYQVAYFHNGDRKTCWLTEWEFSLSNAPH